MTEFTEMQQIILGLLSVCLVTIAFIPETLSRLLPSEIMTLPVSSIEYRLHGSVGCRRCRGGAATQEITFKYPPEIRANESHIASLLVAPVGSVAKLSARLSGSNFELKPSELQEIRVSSKGKTKLSWSLHPKKTGKHILLLDISQLRRSG